MWWSRPRHHSEEAVHVGRLVEPPDEVHDLVGRIPLDEAVDEDMELPFEVVPCGRVARVVPEGPLVVLENPRPPLEG